MIGKTPKTQFQMEKVNEQNICNEVVLVFLPRQIREGKKGTS